MTMPWEEYQTPSTGGPWEEYRKPTNAPTLSSLIAPEVYKGDDYGDTKANPVMRFFGGAKHAWDKAAAALEGAVPGGRALSQTLNQPDLPKLVKQGEQYVKETGPASTLGEIGGEVLLTAAPGAVAYKGATLLPKIKKATELAKRFVGGTAAGVTGATMMGGDAEDVGVTGLISGGAEAVLPPAAKAVWRGAKGVGRTARDLWQGAESQASRYLRDVYGSKTDDVIAALRSAEPSIPGEQLTAGKAVGYEYPEMKVIQQRAENTPVVGPEFVDIDRANKTARNQPLQTMAEPGASRFDVDTGTTVPSEAAQMRSQVTDPLYRRADPQRVSVEGIEGVLNAPEVSAVLRRGEGSMSQGMANETAIGGQFAARPPNQIPDVNQRLGITPDTPFMPVPASRSIDELQRVKNELSRQISALSGAVDGASQLKRDQLMEARRQLNTAMEQSGDYRVANTIFRNFSEPINQARVAQQMLSKGVGTADEDILRKSGLDEWYGDLREVMSPEQMDTIKALRSSAQREADYAATPALEGTVPQAKSVMERIEANLPTWFGQGITALRRGLSRGGQMQDVEIRRIIAEAAKDPKAMADLMVKIPKAEQGVVSKMLEDQRLLEWLGPTRGAAIGYSAGQAQD